MPRRDANTAWYAAADSTAEERRLMCPGAPRPDVVAVLTDTGKLVESVKYGSYGTAFGVPVGDTDSDGDWDATDSAAITGSYEVWKDADLDGDVDAGDVTYANSITGSYQTLGRTVLSSSAVNNRKGYAGYELDPALAGNKMHVRNRVLDAELGRWLRRDPLGYVDGPNAYLYVTGSPLAKVDPAGLQPRPSFCDESFDPPPPPPALNTCGKCARDLLSTCASDPEVVRALSFFNSACEGTPHTVTCSSDSRYCAGALGVMCCEDHTIRLCPGGQNCTALAHELIHAGDSCRGGPCTPTPSLPGCGTFPDCSASLCSEIRAYALDGQCCKNGSLNITCVINGTCRSSPTCCNTTGTPRIPLDVLSRCLPENACRRTTVPY